LVCVRAVASTFVEIVVSFAEHCGGYIWIQLSTSGLEFQRDMEILGRPCKGVALKAG